jgi:hemolysin III
MSAAAAPRADGSQSVSEEIANSITHGIGSALSVAALVVLVVAAMRGTAWHVVSCSIFGASLVLLYLNSTLYHALTNGRAKHVFQVLDHASIYILIAGTYTPFMLVTIRGAWGWSIFGVVWGLAVAGVVFKSLWVGRLRSISTAVYVLMGWIAVVAFRPLLAALPAAGFAWVLAGGVAYTAGVIFFVAKWKYAHAVWHVFVMAGSACHAWAVYRYVLPAG